jgi:TrmH family RNA methyltransferase
MSEKTITSRDNALVKLARAVRDGRLRELIFIEGLRLCEEAAAAQMAIEDVICTEKMASEERGARLLDAWRSAGKRVAIASDSVFASISDTRTPQGILALAARPLTEESAGLEKGFGIPLLVIMHRVNNPANAGAILRTAEAAGATAAILTKGTTDIFAPKALRGAMGSSFRLPLWTGASFEEALRWCGKRGIRTICASLQATAAHTDADWTEAAALVVGAEASGLTSAEMSQTDEALRIPMHAPVESLNVAVAAGIVLYEAARQRAVSSGQ